MNPKITSVLKAILSSAAFYVIFAVGCVFSIGGSTGVLVSAFAEICAAFGGICVMNYLSKRFSLPDEAESEVSAELPDVKRQKTTPTKLLLTLGLSIVCAVALFCVNLLYSRFVYGNAEAPQVSFGVGVAEFVKGLSDVICVNRYASVSAVIMPGEKVKRRALSSDILKEFLTEGDEILIPGAGV